ncbi:MAG: PKD domain-containing protein [Flavobacteriales bacterium]
MKSLLTFILFLTTFCTTWSQKVWMIPNKGQWDERILYNVDLNSGKLLLENRGMTFFLTDAMSHQHHNGAETTHDKTSYHAIKHIFPHAKSDVEIQESDSSSHYFNYLLGSDQSKWKSSIHGVSKVLMPSYFEGIDLIYDGQAGQLSFAFDAQPHADLSQLSFYLEGAENLALDQNGNLIITHSLGTITYSAPKAWNISESGKKSTVQIYFQLIDDHVSFIIPDGYDASERLYIDPSLTFSTFSGSTADNWGFTATPDPSGNLFGGGIVFGTGYPITTGAFDSSFGSGTGMFPMDASITKFNATGTALLFSTFLGGSGNETPHSLVSAPNGELYIYGVTSSSNFPITTGAFDNSFNGGPYQLQNELEFNGSDIYVARLSPNGTALLSSTYVGGTGTDGLNTSSLNFNYGDQFRGEIVLDNNQNVYIASSTSSSNFPTSGASQAMLNGTQDAVIFKFNSTLSNLQWSTYFGGMGNESGNSIAVANNGSIYVCGGTSSASLPISSGNDLTFNGGLSDGFIIKMNGSGSIQAGSYMGLSEYDQAYFVRTDIDNLPYVFGQSESAWTISPGCYGNANSGQFLRKYSSDLMNITWTTMIGASTGHVELSPTAFLVSDCYDIYIAGWGGILNQTYAQAAYSTTTGFHTTIDGYQQTTNGSNFYIAVLDNDATSLKYATFMGGSASSYNHVDGGTSRFDNAGRIYHAVCGACGGNNFGFTSTPGSWSPQNPSPNCNMATFKFELNTIQAIAAQPAPLICIPQSVFFQNNSVNGNAYIWDFGDGSNSTLMQPSHQYTTPGSYDVQLIVYDSTGCYAPDSVTVTVNIGAFTAGAVQPTNSICPGDTYQLDAYGGSTYSWSPANVLNNATIANPIATLNATTTFSVIISDTCGSDTIQVTVNVSAPNVSINNDTTICLGGTVDLVAVGSGTIVWTPSNFLSNTTSFNTTSTPTSSITYTATVTSANGCTATDSMHIQVFFNPPDPVLDDTLSICFGGSGSAFISGGTSYFWYPTNNLIGQTNQTVELSPSSEQYYYCDVTNSCGTESDSIWVHIITPHIIAGNDTIVCPGAPASVWASGASYYDWSPHPVSTANNGAFAVVQNQTNTNYMVIGTDVNGCQDTANVQINVFPPPHINAGVDVYALVGESIQFNAITSGPGSILWTPQDEFTCATCANTSVSPNQNAVYNVYFTDLNGCQAQSQVSVYFDPFIYVPNTFTPDGDEHNNEFRPILGNIREFEMLIFDRWGEIVYEMTSTEDYWDGTYNKRPCQDGTYVWKLKYTDFANNKKEITGHINLLR